MSDIAQFVDERWDTSILPTLHDYVRIPNKSPAFDPDWEAHGYMRQAVELLQAWTERQDIEGFRHEIIALPGRTPVLFAEIASTAPCDDTVLLYGHYDKQPEFEGWEPGLEPWLPVERDGKLYGRGGADDGYALFASLTAIAALQAAGRPHPRCVVLIEGCEESGSFDLPHYVDHLRARIGKPKLVICLDAECGNYDQLWITTSLRGMLPGTLRVKILEEGQHSGVAGGIVPSSFRILRHLIDRVENSATGVLHQCLYADIPAEVPAQLRQVAQSIGPAVVTKFPWAKGAGPGTDDLGELLIANAWKPSLAVVGLGGAPAIRDAGNTLRPATEAKLVFRLPPTVDAADAAKTIKALLERDPPYGASVEFELETAQTGWSAPPEAEWLARALRETSDKRFAKPVMHMGMGGTIPFMKMLGDAYPETQFMVTGVLGPKSNAHGPNEFLHIETARKLTCCVADVLSDAAQAFLVQ